MTSAWKATERGGRRRDSARDGVILEATLAVLAEHGYDRMTIDHVAARCGMARATVYRRWPTKRELVLQAVSRLSHADVGSLELGDLPDTGSLREDMIAMIRPFDGEQQQIRIQAVVGLMSLAGAEPHLAEAARGAGVGGWIEVNHLLIERAVGRGEFEPPDDLHALAELIPMMCISRAAQRLPIDHRFSTALIDGVVLPALRGGAAPSVSAPRHTTRRHTTTREAERT